MLSITSFPYFSENNTIPKIKVILTKNVLRIEVKVIKACQGGNTCCTVLDNMQHVCQSGKSTKTVFHSPLSIRRSSLLGLSWTQLKHFTTDLMTPFKGRYSISTDNCKGPLHPFLYAEGIYKLQGLGVSQHNKSNTHSFHRHLRGSPVSLEIMCDHLRAGHTLILKVGELVEEDTSPNLHILKQQQNGNTYKKISEGDIQSSILFLFKYQSDAFNTSLCLTGSPTAWSWNVSTLQSGKNHAKLSWASGNKRDHMSVRISFGATKMLSSKIH